MIATPEVWSARIIETIIYTVFCGLTFNGCIITREGIRSVCPRLCMEPAPGPEGQTESLRTEVTN